MIEPAAVSRLQTGTASEPAGDDVRAEHLLAFNGEPWAFWRLSGLRGAGLPAHWVLKLAAPGCAAAADALLAAEYQADQCKTNLTAMIRLAMDRSEDKETLRPLGRAISQLNKGRVPDMSEDAFGDARRALTSAFAAVEDARKAFREEFAAAVLGTSMAVRGISHDPDFRQAVLLQNHAAIQSVLHSFSVNPVEKRGSKERQKEELVASYLQRYCVKNDTVGFFGPVGWATLGDAVNDIAVSPGPQLIATSSIYFENWSIEALAEKIAENPAVRHWIPPRRLPECYLDGATLRSPSGLKNLTPQQLAILRLCDGERSARQIASALVGSAGFAGDDDVYVLLAELTKDNVLSWAYEFPLVPHPEKLLRQRLNRIDSEELRQPALAALDRLERARDNVAAAFGNAEQLSHAVIELEKVFAEVTGNSGSRLGGQMYAGRTLFYQDCRRDVEVDIGPDVLDAITPPLSLVLSSARWFSHRVAGVCREAFIKAHGMMAHTKTTGTVDFPRFAKYIQLLLFSGNPTTNILTPVLKDLENRWKRILGPLPEARHAQFSSAHLKPKVDDVFAAPAPEWPLARHHSPDVMIAAASVEAIRRGDCSFVLGEIHACTNTLNSSLFVEQHPCPEEFYQAMASDFPKPRPVLMLPRTFPRVTNRTSDAWLSPDSFHIEVSRDSIYAGERSQAIAASDFVVKKLGNRIVVGTRDGRLEYDAIEFFADLITRASLASFDFMKALNSGGHTPRITIDRLIVGRESWRFPARSLQFIHEENEQVRYLMVRRWMQQHNLPRFAFFKVSVEVKPFYLDFASPMYVEILVKMIRRALAGGQEEESVFFSEMVPGHGESWLPDIKGNLYTSEIRLVVKDLLG